MRRTHVVDFAFHSTGPAGQRGATRCPAMGQRTAALGKQYLYASRSHFYLTGTTGDSSQWRLLKLSRGGRDQVRCCWRFPLPARGDATLAAMQSNSC